MTLTIHEARFLLLEPKKVIVANRDWEAKKNREKKPQIFIFEGRVQIGSAMPRGCWFRSAVWISSPKTFNFQLECEIPGQRQHLTLYRLENQPLSGHLNSINSGPSELKGRYFRPGESHVHSCLDHTVETGERLRAGGVQLARPLEVDLEDYASGLAYVCGKLNIRNSEEIPRPEVQGNLF